MQSILASQLQAAYDSLTPKTWCKDSLFELIKNKPGTCAMCVHGAVQNQVNPSVKACPILTDKKIRDAERAIGLDALWITHNATDNFAKYPAATMQQIWDMRPKNIRKDTKLLGKREAHYLLGMVGLTAKFNDDKNTSLQMIKHKLRKAIALAKILK